MSYVRPRVVGLLKPDQGLRAMLGSLGAGGSLQLVVAASGIFAARLLGVTDRGHLALLWVVTLVIGQLSTVGVHVAIAYEIANGEAPHAVIHALRRVIVAQLLASGALGIAVEIVLFSGLPRVHAPVLLSTAAVPPMFLLLLYGLAIVQGQRRYKAVQLHRLAQPLLYVITLVCLAATGSGDLSTVTLGWSVTMVFGGLFAWRQGLGAWRPAPEVAQRHAVQSSVGDMLRFSRRSIFSAFGIIEHLQADQLLVGLLLSATQFGLYTAGTAFANLPRFLGQSVGYVAYPEVSSAPGPLKRRTIVRFVLLGGLVIGPTVALLVMAVPWLLPLLLGSSFRPAIPVAQILLAGALLQALRRVAAEAIRGLGSGLSATVAEGIFIAVFAGSLLPLTAALGVEGAALASSLASFAAAVAILVLSLRQRSAVALDLTAAQGTSTAVAAQSPTESVA